MMTKKLIAVVLLSGSVVACGSKKPGTTPKAAEHPGDATGGAAYGGASYGARPAATPAAPSAGS